MPRQAPCRGRCLVASGSLSLTGPCRDAWRVAASSLRCLGWPSRQAPLAGALSPELKYFVLEWLQGNHEGPWRSPGKPCRGRCLVASGGLSLPGPCWDAWRIAANSLRCLGGPSRQAPLAGALSPWLGYFALKWLHRNREGPWRSPGKPCRGWLQLPVHKFGILGYPYSSTPTGAPGPGPDTVPSAVGPGPKQGTGTHGLGYAVSLPGSAAPSPNGTR